jgi:hypothetical protein
MNVYTRPDLYSQAPRTALQEPQPPVFTGTPAQVADFVGSRMSTRTHTLALVAGELSHLAHAGWATDSLTFVLADDTSVTVRP